MGGKLSMGGLVASMLSMAFSGSVWGFGAAERQCWPFELSTAKYC